MRSRKLQYLHVNDFTSDFTTILALGPRLRLLNLGRPPADIRICAAEFQNLFRFEPSIAARIAETCIFTFCDNLSSIGQALARCLSKPPYPGLCSPGQAVQSNGAENVHAGLTPMKQINKPLTKPLIAWVKSELNATY